METTPLHDALSPAAQLLAWRVDVTRHAATWGSGIGGDLASGRWNPRGMSTVY